MAITSAQVESNGWVLRLTFAGSLGDFPSYTLDPDGTPRVSLTTTHAGFVVNSGAATAASPARTVVATKPLRKPVVWAGSGTGITGTFVDETDLGGGSIQVRLALSEYVYATDTSLSLAVLAGWRTGESAGSISVTNNSTIPAPLPIMRWMLPQYRVVTGTFRMTVLVGSHHPSGFQPAAGVKFTVTDGTNTKTVWATALDFDNTYGDNLRAYTVTVDPAAGTALTAGLLRCDAEVYPFLGAMRSTDTVGDRSMTALGGAGMTNSATVPFVVGYDPTGTRYNGRYVYVDPASVTAASATMVKTSLAAAQAAPLTEKAKTIQEAVQAIYNANITRPLANGQAAEARSGDGVTIVLAAGVHTPLTSSTTSLGLLTTEIPIRFIGDPADSDPRNNVILRTGTANGIRMSNFSKGSFANMTLEIGTFTFAANPTTTWWLDNVEVRGKSGATTSTTVPNSGTFAFATKSKIWKTGWSPNILYLARANEMSRTLSSSAVIKHRLISAEEDGTISTSTALAALKASAENSAALGQVEDNIVAFSDFRKLRGNGALSMPSATAAAAGTPNKSYRRFMWLNNLFEKIGPTADAQFFSIGETESSTASYNIVEGNTFAGDRVNSFYSDPLPTTIAETNSQLNQNYVNRFANNYLYWLPTKHDAFWDPDTAAVRGTSNGYRPQMVETWSWTYGVNHEATIEGGAANSFALEFYGLRSLRTTNSAAWFVDDRSHQGTDTGGGNYTPVSGSPLQGRVKRANTDVDFNGNTRQFNGFTGAIEATASTIRRLLLLGAG